MGIKSFTGKIHTGSVNINLFPDVNIIVGLNGSGKTLLLQALAREAIKEGIPFAFWPPAEGLASRVSPAAFSWFTKNNGEIADHKIDLEHLSGGATRFLALVTFILDNKDRDILLIDTPETGLHLSLQKVLIDLIRSMTNAQLIIATHSPGITMKGWFDKVQEMHNILS